MFRWGHFRVCLIGPAHILSRLAPTTPARLGRHVLSPQRPALRGGGSNLHPQLVVGHFSGNGVKVSHTADDRPFGRRGREALAKGGGAV